MGYWRPLQRLNNVSQPLEMSPGSTLKVPIRWLKVQPAAVLVLYVQGSAEVTDGLTGKIAPLQANMTLQASDVVRTGSGGNVTLEFADGSRFLVQENSELVLDTLSAYGKTGMVDARLRLQRGRLDARTAPSQGEGTLFEVWTPAATSAVRGTDYRVAMEPEREVALTEVVQGEVAVEGSGQTELVPEGFGTITAAGQPPSPPIPLLDPPDLASLPEVLDRVPIQFALPALDGAVAYRLQIATDPEFKPLLFDRTYSSPQFIGPDVPDGNYALRVRGIDERGLEGRDAIRRVTLDARPEPPLLMNPDDGGTVREPVPGFDWTEPQEARAFHFQLATEGGFAAPLVDLTEYADTNFTPETPLAPGSYQWRVATIATSGEEGPFSDLQSFVLRPAPDSPEVEEPAIEEDMMVLRWRAGLPGQRYQLQLARDSRFADVMLDRTVDDARLEMPRPVPGRYYLRVRTIDVDGFAGAYGSPQKLDVPPTSYWPTVIVPLMALLLLL